MSRFLPLAFSNFAVTNDKCDKCNISIKRNTSTSAWCFSYKWHKWHTRIEYTHKLHALTHYTIWAITSKRLTKSNHMWLDIHTSKLTRHSQWEGDNCCNYEEGGRQDVKTMLVSVPHSTHTLAHAHILHIKPQRNVFLPAEERICILVFA